MTFLFFPALFKIADHLKFSKRVICGYSCPCFTNNFDTDPAFLASSALSCNVRESLAYARRISRDVKVHIIFTSHVVSTATLAFTFQDVVDAKFTYLGDCVHLFFSLAVCLSSAYCAIRKNEFAFRNM